jgi:hypothetical protein
VPLQRKKFGSVAVGRVKASLIAMALTPNTIRKPEIILDQFASRNRKIRIKNRLKKK